MNDLEIGQGAAVAPQEPRANPLEIKPRPRPQSGMMKHFGGMQDVAATRFEKMREAKKQTDAIVQAFGRLTDLQDTVQPRDVVKACAGIVAAGIPAVTMAGILADMPEQPAQLQAWIKDEFGKAQAAEQKVDEGLAVTRHGLVVAAMNNLIGHSVEQQQLMQAPPAGNA